MGIIVLDSWVIWSGLILIMIVEFGSNKYCARPEPDPLIAYF